MANKDGEQITDAVLSEWHAAHDGTESGQPGGLGTQVRDRKIRRLIGEIRGLRAHGALPRDVVTHDVDELRRLRAALDEIASGTLTAAQAIEAARKAREP